MRGIDLDIRAGETVVLLGGSGEGKSVMLRHPNGLLRPDRGEVVVTKTTGVSEKGKNETTTWTSMTLKRIERQYI